jgi:hypothetical protein
VLDKVGLSHRVKPIFAHRSFTWELAKLLKQRSRPQFDCCYFDGGHTWDVTGFGFVLVDMLIRPGGWIIFDDLDWTIERSISRTPSFANSYKTYSADEKLVPGVRLVWDLLLPHFGYVNRSEEEHFHWGIAQKPARSFAGSANQ